MYNFHLGIEKNITEIRVKYIEILIQFTILL